MSACTNKRDLLKDEHPRHHTTASDIVQGVRAGGELQAGRAVAGDWRRSTSRARGDMPGHGAIRAIFARRLMESCKPMPNRPAPDGRASLISGREAAWLSLAQHEGRPVQSGHPPKALQHGSLALQSSISGYVARWLRGTMARLPTAFFPVKDPLPRQQVLVHAFCRTVCMAIATLAAVNQFVFAYLHIRLKLSRTSRLQQSFFDDSPALVVPEGKLDGFKC